MVDVTISLVGANGDEIALSPEGDYVLGTGLTGFGIPATVVRIEDSAGDGGVWRFSKRGVRELDLPIVILGTDRADVQTKLRRLARLLQDRRGATKVKASFSDGSSVYLFAHYVGGAETQYGEDAGGTYCRWVVSMRAPKPFWQTGEDTTFSIGSVPTGRGLLPQLTKLKLTSSETLGTVTVNNEGDVETYPVWTLRGALDYVEITDGSNTFRYNAPIPAGTTITINTEAGTVVDDSGANKYANMATAPKFFTLQPGTSTITVKATGATSASLIGCYFAPRYEVIH